MRRPESGQRRPREPQHNLRSRRHRRFPPAECKREPVEAGELQWGGSGADGAGTYGRRSRSSPWSPSTKKVGSLVGGIEEDVSAEVGMEDEVLLDVDEVDAAGLLEDEGAVLDSAGVTALAPD